VLRRHLQSHPVPEPWQRPPIDHSSSIPLKRWALWPRPLRSQSVSPSPTPRVFRAAKTQTLIRQADFREREAVADTAFLPGNSGSVGRRGTPCSELHCIYRQSCRRALTSLATQPPFALAWVPTAMSKRATKAKANRRRAPSAEPNEGATSTAAEPPVSQEAHLTSTTDQPSVKTASDATSIVSRAEESRAQLLSSIPPTDEIDSDWGDSDDDDDTSRGPVLAAPAEANKASAPSQPVAAPVKSVAPSVQALTPDATLETTTPSAGPPPSNRIRGSSRPFGLSDVPARPSNVPSRPMTQGSGVSRGQSDLPPQGAPTPADGIAAARISQSPEKRSSNPPFRVSAPPPSTVPLSRSSSTPRSPSTAPRSPVGTRGVRDTQPCTPTARAKASSIDIEAESKRGAIEAANKPKADAAGTSDRPVAATSTPPTAAVAQDGALAQSASEDARAIGGSSGHVRKLASAPVLGALWIISAAIPAIIVWLVMRNPSPLVSRGAVGAVQQPAAPQAPADPIPAPGLAEKVPEPVGSPSVALSPSSPAPADSSAMIAASTVPIAVETESSDRISVLIQSKPRSAKVYKRTKSIGRTPLIVQIGRGERHVFDVGVNLGATRRIALDGEKTEITVTLPEVKAVAPNPSAAPLTQ